MSLKSLWEREREKRGIWFGFDIYLAFCWLFAIAFVAFFVISSIWAPHLITGPGPEWEYFTNSQGEECRMKDTRISGKTGVRGEVIVECDLQ